MEMFFSENMDFKLKALHQEYHSAIGTAVIRKMEMFKVTSGQFSQSKFDTVTTGSDRAGDLFEK